MSSRTDLSRELPTTLALVERRIATAASDDAAMEFLYVSYLAEAAIKLIAIALVSALRVQAPDDAYRLGHSLVRADSPGDFDGAIRQISKAPLATFLPTYIRPLLVWLTKRRTGPEDSHFLSVANANRNLFSLLSDDVGYDVRSHADVITALARFRNKTKAHGALGLDFFEAANPDYRILIDHTIEACPAFNWDWLSLNRTQRGKTHGILLAGLKPRSLPQSDVQGLTFGANGLYMRPSESSELLFVGELLKANAECTRFYLPNGGHIENKSLAEFIDYATGSTLNVSVPNFSRPPVPLPPSDTEGEAFLDVQSNVFGNLPPPPEDYVSRPKLETELTRRLLDTNHPIITLHGRGGVGKTSLALAIAHQLAEAPEPRFENIIWFSSRDIDLRPSGPARVRPAITDLQSIAKSYAKLFSVESSIESFARALADENHESKIGDLFIFDNFETVENPTLLQEFLDTHTHLPNKVLITSRQRAFKADFPIEVRGMEYVEARTMMTNISRTLHIEGLLAEEIINKIYQYSEGHAYVIRVLIGELAKAGKYVPPPQVIASRTDIVEAVFERSFNNLSDSGRNVFLIVSNWQSAVSELAINIVLSHRDLDSESGIDECRRLSMITEDAFPDGLIFYEAPKLARVFGGKKLRGDPDALVIRQDLEFIRAFGTASENSIASNTKTQIQKFLTWCFDQPVASDPELLTKIDHLIETAALFWPPAWLELARYRETNGMPSESVAYAFRRAAEEMPGNRDAWLQRSYYARRIGDDATRVSSLVNAVEASPQDIPLISDTARELIDYVTVHKYEIPTFRRGALLQTVRERMERLSSKLEADDLSRLGWLFLLEGHTNEAMRYAKAGLAKDEANEWCRRLADRAQSL